MERDPAPQGQVALLEERIGYSFTNRELAREALTHASHSHERQGSSCNERLEFLGDAVLELLVSDHMYRAYPGFQEGRLTRMRAAVVSEPTLAAVAREADLPPLLLMGRGADITGGRENPAILCDAVEAVIGAIYLDGGIGPAGAFILPRLMAHIARAAADDFARDSKTHLQELLQRKGETRIEYTLDDTSGPPHDRVFTVSVSADGKTLAQGSGRSKKEAQQAAAGEALRLLQSGNESEKR